ncbi:hypothetical protein CDL60_02925 [Roseateles noduli]|nr:hypothetical protein CDL60_02925 [Roseateles noduli]
MKGTTARYQFVGVSQQASGRVDTFEQTTDGGVVTLNAQTLTGATRAVADVAGDETFAIGRWSKGTATTSSGSSTIESSVNAAYHYAVYNVAAAFPATGAYKCDDGRFSSPSLVNGTSSVYFGKGSGTAALSFSATGASVDVSITTTAGSQQATVSATARTIATPLTTAITGNYFGGGEGMSLSIGEGGTNKLRIVAAFQAKAGDSSYRGVATFNCTAQ